MRIERPFYIDALSRRMGNGMIKIVTGLRRAGKSYLLSTLFRDYLRSRSVDDSHVVSYALDMLENERFLDPQVLLADIKAHIRDGKTYYIFIDEIQMLPKFEKVMNSLLHIPNADVYITGSNSKLLTTDVDAAFRGRGDEIHLFPLSFSEFMGAWGRETYQGWQSYLMYGGLPELCAMDTDAQKKEYLQQIFRMTYMKDILQHNEIRKIQELDDLIDILASDIGSLTNPTRIAATFKSTYHSSLGVDTIISYIGILEDAFLISEARRFDVKGRHYIGSPKKYYFEDVGLRNARLGFRQYEMPHLLKNVVYNELRMRGYSVDVGVVPVRDPSGEDRRLEIDFVANRGGKKIYVQAAHSMAEAEKEKQEKRPLLKAGDNFPKIIVTSDLVPSGWDKDGVEVMNVFDFLLDPSSLSH